MEFHHISFAEDNRVQKIFASYTQTFPPEERRSHAQFYQLFSKPQVQVLSVHERNSCVGYLIIWQLNHFVFVEHFEVYPEFRNSNKGSAIIEQLNGLNPQIVLETEPATADENAQRRIAFYMKKGFAIIDETYMQPAYDAKKKSLNLWLLANWKPENLSEIKQEIYRVVYG